MKTIKKPEEIAVETAISKCKYLKNLVEFNYANEKERQYLLSLPKEILFLSNKQQIVIEIISSKKNIFIYKELLPYIKLKKNNEFNYVEKIFKYHNQIDIYNNKTNRKIAVIRKFRKVLHSIVIDNNISFQDIFSISTER